MKDKDQVHRDLLGKLKKLEGDAEIYVGAGTSSAGEPIFFAMEKLDNKNAQIWTQYADTLFRTPGVIQQLRYLNINCQNQEIREEFKEKIGTYAIELMDTMCRNQKKFKDLFGLDGIGGGIVGFYDILFQQRLGKSIYVAYASSKPITGPFGSKRK